MRLAKRKMSRLSAIRRGQVRTTIYGLNGLGRRYIRVRNPEHPGMVDVVCEVMNVSIDFARAQVVFDVIQADVNIDDWDPAEEEGELPAPIERPEPVPSDQEAARTIKSPSVQYPLTSDASSITVAEFTAIASDGSVVSFPATTITGLTELSRYGVFYKPSAGYEVEEYPAPNRMATGSWLFIGWQSTSDTGGSFPSNPTPPGGWGGNDEMMIRE